VITDPNEQRLLNDSKLEIGASRRKNSITEVILGKLLLIKASHSDKNAAYLD